MSRTVLTAEQVRGVKREFARSLVAVARTLFNGPLDEKDLLDPVQSAAVDGLLDQACFVLHLKEVARERALES